MTRPKTAGQVATELADTQGGTVQEHDWGTDRERYVVTYGEGERAVVHLDDAFRTLRPAVLVRYEMREDDRWVFVATRVVD